MIVALLIATPLLFATLGAVFLKRSKIIGNLSGLIWLGLATALLLQVAQTGEFYYSFANVEEPLGIRYKVSGFSAIMVFLTAFITFATTLYSSFFHKISGLFFPLVSFLSCGLAIVFLSNDLFNIYVGLEIVGLVAVGLTAYGKKEANIQAAINYLFATLIGSGLYLLAVALIYAQYGVLDITLLSSLIQKDATDLFIFLLIVFALALKTALFPLFFWLPNAHANALSPISALLSAIVIKSSFYLLYILYKDLFTFEIVGDLLGHLGIVAIVYGGIKALLSKDIKLLIAYSSVSQIGYLFLVFSLDSLYGFYGVVFQILAHALAKAGLFLAAGIVVYYFASKTIEHLKGISQSLGVTTFAIALSGTTLMGLPPSLGFFAKWNYLLASFESGQWQFIIAISLGTFLSISYVFKILILTLETQHHSILYKDRSIKAMEYISFVLSFLSVILGLFAKDIIEMAVM